MLCLKQKDPAQTGSIGESPSAYSLVVIRSYRTMACFFEKSREKLKKTGKEAKK